MSDHEWLSMAGMTWISGDGAHDYIRQDFQSGEFYVQTRPGLDTPYKRVAGPFPDLDSAKCAYLFLLTTSQTR